MKRLILFIIIANLLSAAFPVCAEEPYITLESYPYSSHVLGEDLVIYGDTNIDNFTIALRYPLKDYMGITIYSEACTAQELRKGYVIKTEPFSFRWPEGDWIVKVQDGDYYDEIIIPMTKEPIYNRSIKVAVYENDALTDLVSYPCRGTLMRNNTISFSLSDNTHIKIFSWNGLSPASMGETRIFITSYNDGSLTDIKSYSGEVDDFGKHFTLKISDSKYVKLFYWQDGMIPIQ